jgi:predicted amidohydrolase YtcJ
VSYQSPYKNSRLNVNVGSGIQSSNIIFFGGPILTINDEYPEVEAMAICEGKIVALGDQRSVLQYYSARTRMVDLQGCALMPGFVDPHVHLAWSAFTNYRWINVAPPIVGNLDELKEVVRAAATRNGDSDWIIACGYDSSPHSPQQPALNASELDAISTRHPIFVLEQSWDVAYVNHKALEVAGITEHRAGPTSSSYVRDAQGNLTGEIRGATAFAALAKSFPVVTFEQKLRDCKAMLRSWSQQGCTTIYDVAVGSLWGHEEIRLFLEMASDPFTPMRMRAAMIPTDGLPATAGLKSMQGNDRLCFAGIKFWADGIAPGVVGAFDQPFMSGIENYRLHYKDAELLDLMQSWHDAGWQLLVHASSREAIEQTLCVYEWLLARSARPDHRHRIEHCTVIDESQLLRAKRIGVSISHLIGHVYWGNIVGKCFAGERSIVPLASDFDAGICVSVHSDSPATPVEPLRYLQTAVTRNVRKTGDVLSPSQRISIQQALKTVTIYPAYQCFLEDKVGSLEVGKLADLVVLDRNPYEVEPDQISEIKVLETYLEGAPLLSDGLHL